MDLQLSLPILTHEQLFNIIQRPPILTFSDVQGRAFLVKMFDKINDYAFKVR